MKTTVIKPQPTNKDLLKATIYVFGSFALYILIPAGADLIDQIMLWIK